MASPAVKLLIAVLLLGPLAVGPKTLSQFLPVPVDGLLAEFAEGLTPVDICARSIRTLVGLGVKHFYVSNLPLVRTASVLSAILAKAGLTPAR